MNQKEYTSIKIVSGDRVFFYNGIILSEDADFIIFDDRKIGEIRLNKKFIISVEKRGDENERESAKFD